MPNSVTYETFDANQHQLIFDADGNLIGIRNPRAGGNDLIIGAGGGSVALQNNLTGGTTPGTTALDAAQGPAITALIGAREPVIPTGTSAQYVRGDKTLATFPTAGAGTVTSVGVTAPATGITSSGGPVTAAGSITLALANDLAAVEGLATTGLVRRTGADAWSAGTAVDLAAEVSGLLPKANGGTGTATPGIVAGTNVTVSGAWPNQTINSTASGTGTVTSVSVTTGSGVSGSVSNATTTPAISLTLGAITPASVASTGAVTGSNLSGTNTGDQTITLTGDVTGTGTGNVASTLAASGVTAGSYTAANITVDAKGRVTAAANSTAAAGTVTSVAATAPAAGLTVTGSPITSSGTLALALANDLSALEALSGTGIPKRTGVDTWSLGTVALGSDVSGNLPVGSLGSGTGASSTTFWRGDGTWATPSGSGAGTVTATAGALTLNAIMLGAGGVDSKVLASLGTTTTVLHGNAAGAPTYGAVSLTADVSGILPVANGGSGTATPGLVQGANITITGTWPAQTIAAPAPTVIVNDLTTGGNTSALAAAQGVVLKGLIDTNTTAIATKQDKGTSIVVSASRNLASTDFGAKLVNASGAYTLTIPTGLGIADDIIFFHPYAAGTQTLAAAGGVTLNDPYTLGLTVPVNGFSAIQCDGSNVWSRVA